MPEIFARMIKHHDDMGVGVPQFGHQPDFFFDKAKQWFEAKHGFAQIASASVCGGLIIGRMHFKDP